MYKGFLPLMAVALLLLPNSVGAIVARLAHETGNANASRRAASESLELENNAELVTLNVFARRDAFAADRNLTNVLALAGAGLNVEGHRFVFSLGSHYRQQRLAAREVSPGSFYPALGFTWSTAQFRADVAGSEFATRASTSVLLQLGVPVEFNSEFEYLFSQPYRWVTQAYAFVSSYGGLILGYEPLSQSPRAGLWLSPFDSLKLRTVARFGGANETYLEFSLTYSIESASGAASIEQVDTSEPRKRYVPKPRRLPQKVPAFATLIKWGLTPVEALRFTREKDACALSESARASLARKNWGCRDAT